MKIYEIGTGYTPIPAQMGAATEIVVEQLGKAFLKAGKDVEIIDVATKNRGNIDVKINEVKIPSIFMKKDVTLGIMHKLKRVAYSVALAFKIKKILKQTKDKVVLHFHNQYNLFFTSKLVSKKYLKKSVIAYTNHSYIWHGNWQDVCQTVKKRYFQEIAAMHRADIVFVLNTNTYNNVTQYCGINEKKVYIIKNGVNTDVYKPIIELEGEINEFRNKKVFVQVGSVCQRKNQLYSLEILLKFMKQNENIMFCYAGGIIDEEYQNKIIEFAKQNDVENRVRYFGELVPGKVLNDFYNSAVAMIFPSLAEGFSLTVIEAMSAGVPVIIKSDLDFKLADKCLKFSNQNDFEKLMNFILNDSAYEKTRSDVRLCVEKEYSWGSIADDYYKYFENCLGENT